MFSLYYNYWEYWQLYHKVTFDGINKLILINPGETLVDVQEDIYSAWKEWMLLRSVENFRYVNAFNIVGGDPLTAGQFLDSTYFLINGWKIKPYAGSYTLTLIGNIFDVNGGEIKVDADVDPLNPNNIVLNTQVSTIVRRISSTDTAVTASLVSSQATQLNSIETVSNSTYNTVLSQSSDISTISGSSAASYNLLLTNSSSIQDVNTIVAELQIKLDELWQVHGLKVGFPVHVTQTDREVVGSSISQSFVTVGEGLLQNTTVTRV